jgi:hypothetical protein
LSPATRTIPIIRRVRPTINKIEPGMIHHLDSGPLLPDHGLLHAASPLQPFTCLESGEHGGRFSE